MKRFYNLVDSYYIEARRESSWYMQQVRPWLFIGKYTDTLNRDLLERSKIRAILELADPVEHGGITSLYLPVNDGEALRSESLANGVAFVRSEYAQGSRVLIACGAGVSRAVAFAIAALKEEEGCDLVATFLEIAKVYPQGMPHPALWDSLCKYYDEAVPFLDMWRQIRRSISEDWEELP